MDKASPGEKKPLFGIFKNNNEEKGGFNLKDKKLLFKLTLIVILGVALMTFSNYGKSSGGQSGRQEEITVSSGTGGYYSSEEALEARLEEILSKIGGAGEVKVAVSFKATKEVEYAYNSETSESISTEEGPDTVAQSKDQENRESLTLATENDNPVIVKEYMPEVQGVLVVATGAGDPEVKQKLFSAVEGLLALPAHRIVISD